MRILFHSEHAPVATRSLLHRESDYSVTAAPVALRRGFVLAAARPLNVPSRVFAPGTWLVCRLRKTLARVAVCLLGSARDPARAVPGQPRASGSYAEPAGFFRGRSHERALPHPSTTLQERNPQNTNLDCIPMKILLSVVIPFWALSAVAQDTNSVSTNPTPEAPPAMPAIAQPSPFLPTNWNVGFTLGAGFGVKAMGSTQAHGLTAASIHVGKLLVSDSPTPGPVFRHLELAGELWGGAQYHPETAGLAGFTPIARYHLLPGSRLAPFLDAGAGVTGTDIGHPDLSTRFEFNLQAGGGIQWFWRENLALTLQARYLHISNAGIDSPNEGVNTFLFSGGMSWFF